MAWESSYDSDTDDVLVPGALRGYRCWRLATFPRLSSHMVPTVPISTWYPDGIRLHSVAQPFVWPEYTVVAECLNGQRNRDGHRAPLRGCTCGIYAMHTPDADPSYPLGDTVTTVDVMVPGVIEVTGRTRLGRRGFKGERARIAALTIRTPRAALIESIQPIGRGMAEVGFYVGGSNWLGGPTRCILEYEGYSGQPPRRFVEERLLDMFARMADGLTAAYPDARAFDSVADMVRAFPPVPVTHLFAGREAA